MRRSQNFAKSPPYFCPQYLHTNKRKVEISQNFVAFSEYMNFKCNTKELTGVQSIKDQIRAHSYSFFIDASNNLDDLEEVLSGDFMETIMLADSRSKLRLIIDVLDTPFYIMNWFTYLFHS